MKIYKYEIFLIAPGMTYHICEYYGPNMLVYSEFASSTNYINSSTNYINWRINYINWKGFNTEQEAKNFLLNNILTEKERDDYLYYEQVKEELS